MKRAQATVVPRSSRPPAAEATPISPHRLVNFLHARIVELATAVYLLYVLLGTLVPFDFTWSPADAQERALLGLGTTPSGLPDLMSNIGLYVPLGVLLYWSLVRNLGGPRLSVLLSTAIAAATSLAVESIQLLSPTRTSSAVDFGANLFGAAAGTIIACLCHWPERRLLAALARELRADASAAVVKVCAALLVIGGLAPFTPTIDMTRLAHSARGSSFVPFAEARALAAQARQANLEGRTADAAGFQRDRMHLWARWFAELLSFGLFGYLLYRLLRNNYGFKPTAATALLFYLAALLALLISGLQIGVMSRGFRATEVVMRLTGALAGAGAAGVLARVRQKRSWSLAQCREHLSDPTLAVALALVLFTGLAPFYIDLDVRHAAAKLASDDLLPFYAYHTGRFDRVCADFWGKTLRYGFLGIALWVYWRGWSGRSAGRRALGIATIALLISASVETCQVFLLSRIPSFTDVIIAGFAASVGMVCAQYVADFYRHAVGDALPPQPGQIGASRTLTPTDELIATLIPDGMPQPQAASPSADRDHRQ